MDSCENSTKQLECRLILTRSSSLVWTLSHADSPLCSGVHCRLPLSVSRRQLLLELLFQLTLFSPPLPLPVTARFQVQNPLSGFAPKQTKESSAWRATYIVLHYRRTPNSQQKTLSKLLTEQTLGDSKHSKFLIFLQRLSGEGMMTLCAIFFSSVCQQYTKMYSLSRSLLILLIVLHT